MSFPALGAWNSEDPETNPGPCAAPMCFRREQRVTICNGSGKKLPGRAMKELFWGGGLPVVSFSKTACIIRSPDPWQFSSLLPIKS